MPGVNGHKRATLYLRRSTDKQEQSIADQRAELERYAAEHEFLIMCEYTDDAISGTSANGRAGFLHMVEDAELPNCPFRYILAWDIKRFSRGDNDEAGYYRHLLKQRGVEVIYANEGLTGADSDDLVRSVKQYLARQESKDLSRVTIRGQLSSVRGGWWSGGTPPYGYDLEYLDTSRAPMHRVRYLATGEKHVLDLGGNVIRTLGCRQRQPKGQGDKARLVLSAPERVEVVREIFRMYTQRGMGFRAIANELNGRRIPPPKNGTGPETSHTGWSQSTVRGLLFNPVYVGDIVWNRRRSGKFHRIADERAVDFDNSSRQVVEWNNERDFVVVPNTHPAIIDRETWAEVERLRAEKEKKVGGSSFRGGRAKDSPYELSGLIRCGQCGLNYVGQSINKGKPRKDDSRIRTRYYMCAGYLSRGTHICRKTPIPAEALEKSVWATIGGQVKVFLNDGGTEVIRQTLTRELTEDVARHTPDPRQIKVRMSQIEQDIKRLLGSITPVNTKYIDQEIIALESEKETLEQQLARAKSVATTAAKIDAVVAEIASYLQDFESVVNEGTREERKEFIRLFVEGIELDTEGKRALLRIRKFPAPSEFDAGKLSFGLVAGAGFEPATFGL